MATIVNRVGHSIVESPDDKIAHLFDLLAERTLDPTFEEYGDFLYPAQADVVAAYERAHGATFDVPRTFHVSGNFADYSCTFSVYTDDADLIERFRAAITANKRTASYKAARKERRDRARYWKQQELARSLSERRARRVSPFTGRHGRQKRGHHG